jgi:hypothetical protein
MPRSARLDVPNLLQHVTRQIGKFKGILGEVCKEWGVAGAGFEEIPGSKGKPGTPYVLSPGP